MTHSRSTINRSICGCRPPNRRIRTLDRQSFHNWMMHGHWDLDRCRPTLRWIHYPRVSNGWPRWHGCHSRNRRSTWSCHRPYRRQHDHLYLNSRLKPIQLLFTWLLTFMTTFCQALVTKFKTETSLLLSSPRMPPKKPTSFAETIAQEWCEILPISLPVVLTYSQPTCLLELPYCNCWIEVRLTRQMDEMVPSLRSRPPWMYMYSLPLEVQMKAQWFERRSGSFP